MKDVEAKNHHEMKLSGITMKNNNKGRTLTKKKNSRGLTDGGS